MYAGLAMAGDPADWPFCAYLDDRGLRISAGSDGCPYRLECRKSDANIAEDVLKSKASDCLALSYEDHASWNREGRR